MQVLKKHEERFTSRGFGQGLLALAHVSKSAKNEQVREFLASYIHHPKPRIRTAAVSALGRLGNAKAIAILEAFDDSGDDRLSRAAQSALKELRAAKPLVPRELVELREEVAEIKKTNEELKKEIQELRQRSDARATQ